MPKRPSREPRLRWQLNGLQHYPLKAPDPNRPIKQAITAFIALANSHTITQALATDGYANHHGAPRN